MDNASRFNQYVEALQQYISREGHALVPAHHKEILNNRTITLGTWVSYMRQRNKATKLPENQKNVLDSIPQWNWGPLSPGPKPQMSRNTEIAMKSINGKSLTQLADQYNLSRQRVHQIVKRTTNA